MQTSQREGMKTMNQALYELYQKNVISKDDAFARASDPDDLARLFKK
jgi:Tfp pilus assembly ATPase PilU